MTTFTKLPEGEKPLIEVDAGKKLAKIDDMIYGGFTEYVPRPSHTRPQPWMNVTTALAQSHQRRLTVEKLEVSWPEGKFEAIFFFLYRGSMTTRDCTQFS